MSFTGIRRPELNQRAKEKLLSRKSGLGKRMRGFRLDRKAGGRTLETNEPTRT
jgi:hypothetical protein